MSKSKNSFQPTPLVIVIILCLLLMMVISNHVDTKTISYSELLNSTKKGEIQEITWSYPESHGLFKKALEETGTNKFKVYIPNPEDIKLFDLFEKNNVKVTAEAPKSGITMFILNILPFIFVAIFIFLIFKHMQVNSGQALSFGRSKAKLLSDDGKKVNFEDVAGIDEAKEELNEIVDFLKDPEKYKKMGARIPKGILLLGAPGTGKTLLGRAVAGEAGVPFFFMSGSDFVEMFVGVGASRVRDLFEQAKKSAPCIVFIDEIDAVGRQRGTGMGGGHDEREQTLNQLLVEMDGFEPNNGVIILAATNRHDVLDPALLRPGRFDRHIVVDRPDMNGRKDILQIHSKNKPISSNVDLNVIAQRTPGFSGADLENLLNEAALLAARRNYEKIDMPECEEAIERVIMGPERKSRVILEKEKKIIAYHETGHAIVSMMTPGSDPVRKVTILPRGMALGVTWSMPEEDRHLHSKTELIAQIMGLLGGRATEEVVFKDVTTGASNDLERATGLAKSMIKKYGMSESLGLVTYGKNQDHVFLGRDLMGKEDYSEYTAQKIDTEVKTLIDHCYEKTKELIVNNMDKINKIVEVLLVREVLDASELEKLVNGEELEELKPKSEIADTDKNGAEVEETTPESEDNVEENPDEKAPDNDENEIEQ